MIKNICLSRLFVAFSLSIIMAACSDPEYKNQINSEGQRDGYWKLYLDKSYKPTPLEVLAPFYALLEYDDGAIDSDVMIHYRTGELHWKGTLLSFSPFRVGDGVNHFYHRNGTLQAKIPIKDQQIHGNAIEWFESGNKQRSCSYAHGLKDGVETIWDAQGCKTAEIHWNMGKKYGTEITWFNVDKIRSYTEWKNDILHGRKMYYDLGFKIVENYSYGQLNGIREEYWPNGDLRVTTSYLNGIKHGPEIGYYNDGRKKSLINWNTGLENGICQCWHPNGVKEEESTYSNGKQTGIQVTWDSLGNITSKSEWDNGNFLGVTYERK